MNPVRTAWRLFFAAVIILCMPWQAFSQAKVEEIPLHVHEGQAVKVRLFGSACVDPVSRAMARRGLPPSEVSKLRALASNWLMPDGSRQDFPGCWLELGTEAFLVIFSDSTYDVVPRSEFRKMRGQLSI